MDQAATLVSSLLMLLFVALLARNAVCDELDVKEYVARYRSRDLTHNNGTGNSTYTNSSSLAWGESYILANYITLHRVTGDVHWLKKVT